MVEHNEKNVNKDNPQQSLGGLASSHHPDNSGNALGNNETTQLRHQSTASPSLLPSAPLMSVLRNEGGSNSTPSLQFESNSNLLDELEDSDDEPPRAGEKRSGRRKIKIEYIEDKSRRHITFSKRKAGIMKKAYELSTLTGTQVLLLVASETGHVYTFATPKLQPLITKQEGKNLIQACLNSPDSHLAIPDYPIPTASSSNSHAYDSDLIDDDLVPRTASSSSIPNSHNSHNPHNLQSHHNPHNQSQQQIAPPPQHYLPQQSSTPPAGSSAASVAAAAAQAFMNSGGSNAVNSSAYHPQYAQQSQAYWNAQNTGAIFNNSKSSQQQQQQIYHALLQQQQQQQQQQLFQQYQQQQQHHNQHHQNQSHDQDRNDDHDS